MCIRDRITGTAALGPGRYRVVETGSNLKAQLAWRATDSGVLVYALAAEGFRPGGVNITPELTAAERRFAAEGSPADCVLAPTTRMSPGASGAPADMRLLVT